ncbi:MAG: excinuclease ABC subunit UvrA [Nanoarchaeota archaeon]
MKNLIIKRAREHNLKNINVEIPRNKLVVITGLSGSGKSTLAFDTIYAEGQRRYVESLSSYARQFLGLMNKPDVDSIEGLSPAISIDQKTTSKNPRSTVGTVTEIYDYLRLLFARVGDAYCPLHNIKIESNSPEKIKESIKKNTDIIVYAPIVRQKKGTYEKLIEDIQKDGFMTVRVNNKEYSTNEKIPLERYKKHDIDILIDELNTSDESRLIESLELALKKSKGLVIIKEKKGSEKLYSQNFACPICNFSFEELQPRMFSFNSPFGACEVCHGLGIKMEFDPDLIIPDKNKSIADGAIMIYRNAIDGWRGQMIGNIAKNFGFSILTPIKDLTKEQFDILMYGSDKEIKFTYNSRNSNTSWNSVNTWEGLIPQSERLYQQTESDYRRNELEKFMRVLKCPRCNGKRLNEKALAVKIDNMSIIDVTNLSILNSIKFFLKLKLSKTKEKIAKQVLKEINSRLDFLKKVGLDYLTLSRSASTLSGGEAQRIRLATQIGSSLTGVLYVLDEPSIGLHQRDNQKLIDTLKNLRDQENSVIVVEHDEDTILASDFVIDIGPYAGVNGGEIVATGTPSEIRKNKNSLTAKYLNSELKIDIPKTRRKSNEFIKIIGANENNLKNIDVKIPLSTLCLITGVSGSGKSTLIYEILYKAMMKKLHNSKEIPGKHKEILFDSNIDKVIIIDQSPIGKTPRSNPATYTKVFDEIRSLFSQTKDAKLKGYKQGRFSFNVSGGRCENCHGDGVIKIEMNFLPDVYVECEECKGKRYNKETLEIKFKNKNISDVLNMSVDEAYEFFVNIPRLKKKLETLKRVGLGYVKLGQSSTTLSGGEAQRIKITRELSKRSTGKTLYLLDEPTTGLHFHDVKKLIKVLNDLTDKKNTVIVIEHNLDVIKSADYIIDIGPEGGEFGGEIIATGTPEELIKNKKSYTSKYLKKVLLKQ